MSAIGIKVDGGIVEINTGKKLPEVSAAKTESCTQTNIPADSLKNSTQINRNSLPKTISFSTEPEKHENKLLKSVLEGAKIKGAVFGAQYMAAGAAIGFGYELAALKFVPNAAIQAPKFIGASSPIAKALVIGSAAGVIGLSIGSIKGAVDGAIVNVSPSKGFAVGALSLTSALVSMPALKISKPIGIAAIAVGAVGGAFYGAHIYDNAHKK